MSTNSTVNFRTKQLSVFLFLLLISVTCGKSGSDSRSASPATGGDADTTAPTVLSTTPANAATGVAPCTGNPCVGKIVIVFSESMNTGLTQTLTTEIHNGSSFSTTPNSSTTYTWGTTTSSNDTLTINISWYWFPENSQIRYTLAASGIKDTAQNVISADVQGTFTTTAANQAFAVADTGQTGCFNNTSGPNVCPQAGGLHPGQDADFTNIPVARSFTGPTQHGTYTADYTTLDNVTNLIWKSCNEGQSGATCATGTAASASWNNAINQCSSLNTVNSGVGYAGKTTWRLPTIKELETLPNYNVNNPAIESTNFPSTTAYLYWAAGAQSGVAGNGMGVGFDGSTSPCMSKGCSALIRCVSSPATITTSGYTENGDGTVTDTATNLRWQKCSRGQNNDATCSGTSTTGNWSTALQYCDTLNLGSFGNSANWRLPSQNELKSLVDKSVSNPSIKAANFPATVSGIYWSSSTSVASVSQAWFVAFTNGGELYTAKTGTYSVRCVATGP